MKICGHTIDAQLNDSPAIAIYRAHEQDSGKPVVLKLPASSLPTPEIQARIRQEFQICSLVRHHNVIEVYRLDEHQHRLVLIQEFFPGVVLSSLAGRGASDPVWFIDTALQLIEALRSLHRQNIICKNIRPDHLLYRESDGRLKLINLGAASLSNQELSFQSDQLQGAGELAYISPEQTGRLTRSLDYRTDFYSLGVVLYQLLTCYLPFEAHEPSALIHAHIAETPVHPSQRNPAVPEDIAAIILKLLKKPPEERYQDLGVIQTELVRCRSDHLEPAHFEIQAEADPEPSPFLAIPEKLYGRVFALQKITESYTAAESGVTNLVLISGGLGIGRTSLLRNAGNQLRDRGVWTVPCRCSDPPSRFPFLPLLQGFREIIVGLSKTEPPLRETWKARLCEALGTNLGLFVELLPETAAITGSVEPCTPAPAAENKTRIRQTIKRFVSCCSQHQRPLAFLIDDIHLLDPETFSLLEDIARDPGHSSLLVYTMPASEDGSEQPAELCGKRLEQNGAAVSRIRLQPLSVDTLALLLSETLFQPVASTLPLARACVQKTGGNPLLLKSLLKKLEREQGLRFDREYGRWELIQQTVRTAASTASINQTMTRRLQRLPPRCRDFLGAAACIGNSFDLGTLAAAVRRNRRRLFNELAEAMRDDLIRPLASPLSVSPEIGIPGETSWHFSHESIREAAADQLPASLRQELHLQIGRVLWHRLTPGPRQQQLPIIADHQNHGRHLLQSDSDRRSLAEINLGAARQAKWFGANAAYYRYASTGRELLPENAWDSDYDLTLALHQEMLEAAYRNGEVEELERLFQIICDRTVTSLERVPAFDVRIRASAEANRPAEAVDFGLKILAELGLVLPPHPRPFEVWRALLATRVALHGRNHQALLELPRMTDPHHLAIMDCLVAITDSASYARPPLMVLIAATAINLSLRFGNHPGTAVSGYAVFGYLRCNLEPGGSSHGYRLGRLAVRLGERLHGRPDHRSLYLFHSMIAHWRQPLRETLAPIQEAHRLALACGDRDGAARSAYSYCHRLFLTGQNLVKTFQEQQFYGLEIARSNQLIPRTRQAIFQQAAANLLGRDAPPDVLDGSYCNARRLLRQCRENGDQTTVFIYHLVCLMLAYFCRNYARAGEHGEACKKILPDGQGSVYTPLYHFYYALSLLETCPADPGPERRRTLRAVKSSLKKIKGWAGQAPVNYQHKYHLLLAETARVLGEHETASAAYDHGIDLARTNGYLHEEGLGLDLAARYYFRRGRTHLAAPYLREALYCYERWGAQALVQLIQKGNGAGQAPNPAGTPAKLASSPSLQAPAPWFDTMSFVKAAGMFSGEVVMTDLLRKLVVILLENAGAQIAFLLLRVDREWTVKAKATSGERRSSLLDAPPSIYRHQICQTIVNHVIRTGETIVLNRPLDQGPFTDDLYIREHRPKSLLCMPVLHHGEPICIIYLENNLTEGAFGPERIEIIKLISSQAAVSIRNSMLYNELEETIQKLNREVERRKETQLQLLRAGKLSALGRLSASIAHEFGNPLIGLKYLLEDFASRLELSGDDRALLQTGLQECARLKKLIEDLHELHKPSTGSRSWISLNEVVNNVLALQRNNLKKNRIQLELRLNPELPPLRAVEDQITQAVVSVMINATDSMASSGGRMTVRTDSDRVRQILEITDTGCGIPPECQEHIFEPFFSTRESPEGAGLGLAITYSIVKSHGGEISFSSTVGSGTTFLLQFPHSGTPSTVQP